MQGPSSGDERPGLIVARPAQLPRQRGAGFGVVIGPDGSQPLMTIDASPGVYSAPGHRRAVATLTLVPRLQVLTGDLHAGAEIVDAVLAALLGDGFALVTTLGAGGLAQLPLIPGRAVFSPREGALRITAGCLDYDGDIGPAAPAGWARTAGQRRALVVLVATGIDLHAADRTARIDQARAGGRLVGGRLGFTTEA